MQTLTPLPIPANIPILKGLNKSPLPPSLVDRLSNDKQISITGNATHCNWESYGHVRGFLWDLIQPLDPNRLQARLITFGIPDSKRHQWAVAAGRNPLHYAAALGDVLAAYELLFMGTSPKHPDKLGLSPLYYALLSAARLKVPTTLLRINSANFRLLQQMIMEHEAFDALPANLSHICELFIGQHVNVNEAHYGTSVLHLACIAQDWKVVGLLLQHGARNTVTDSLFATLSWDKSAQETYTALVAEHAPAKDATFARPARPCPCWSGKLLEDCHQRDDVLIKMDDKLPCICGNHHKKFSQCCQKKQIVVTEHWDAIENGIRRRTCNLPESLEKTEAARFLRIAGYKLQHCFDDEPLPDIITGDEPPTYVPWPTKKTNALRDKLLNEGKIDPAYAWILSYKRPPIPISREKNIRNQVAGAVEEWNRYLELYIRLGVDPRPAETIRRAAKMSTWGGAFYSTCVNPGCGKMNGINGVSLLKCGNCLAGQYCSESCQMAHWKAHKKICRDPERHLTPQELPSQKAFDAELEKIMDTIPEFQQYLKLKALESKGKA
ncbi:hypothetical protein CVT24_008255 [Panaeolus cyanescens]|uniref:MYND-type domain-containing protein n=1 Tax=Panaeolus cyanescens TaxID=181874 RepID=A0A409VF90_9AGAR|nr:hypothetical protein CVT24_008255 [Panaeolus cyanescens]